MNEELQEQTGGVTRYGLGRRQIGHVHGDGYTAERRR